MTPNRRTPYPARGRPPLRLFYLLIACVTFASPAVRANAQATGFPRADWPAFLARHDLIWTHLPSRWGDAAFIGNGNLGATIFVRDSALAWTINQTDVVAQSSRFPIGRVRLVTKGAQRSGHARLVLWDAEARGEVITDSGSVLWRSYASTTPSVIVIELEGRDGERAADLGWVPDLARPPRKVARRETFEPADLHPDPIVRATRMNITSVQTFIGGGAHAEWIRRGSRSGGKEIFYVTIGKGSTGDEALDDARREVNVAESFGAKKMRTQHRAIWHPYYPSSFLSFPDPRLEGYYWIQIYKLGSAMREDGPILDLNGPWFAPTPWPAIWWNLNIQLTYSPLFRANRLGLSESLFRNLDKNTQALIENVPERLRADAAAIGRSSGPNLVRPVDLATATTDAALEAGNLPWTMFYYWQYYAYTMNDDILRRRVYPLLSRAIGNYLGYVEKGSDGKYHLPKTHSPELASIPDANYDLSLLEWGLQTLIASAERLKINDAHLPPWRDVLANLTPFPQDSTGLLVGRDRPWKESHRHYSHLLAIYPLGLITPDKPEERDLIERSLATWEGASAAFRGYSYTGGASMHAMLGQGDEVVRRLNLYLDAPRYMEPNTFYAEAGPVIETPLAAAATMQELFLQDWGNALRVFHAIPTTWKDASFDRLRGAGAFLVSAVRANGRTAWVRVHSIAGAPGRLIVDDWQSAVVRASSGKTVTIRKGKPGEFALDIPAGGWVLLAPDSSSALPPVAPVPTDSTRYNRWPSLAPDPTRTSAAPGKQQPRSQ